MSGSSSTSTRRRSDFGSVRELPSGRFRATYRTSGVEHTAPTTFRTKTDAKRYLASVRASIEKGTWSDPRFGKLTVEEVGERWLDSNPNKAHTTVARDTSILKNHVYPKLGRIQIRQLTRFQIQTLVNEWSGAPTTIHRQHRSVSAICTYAAKNGWIPRNPCVDIQLPECLPVDRHLLSPEDTLKIASVITGYHSTAIWTFAETGCRWGEVYGLRIRNVDLAQFTIQIEQGLTRDPKGAPILGRRGSRKARPRMLAITPWLAALLQQHLESLEHQGPDAWLFPDSTGGPVRYSNWRRRVWLPALAEAGLDNIEPLPGPHDLRRLNVTQLAASGVDLRTLMSRMGHKSAKLALEVYAKPDPVADRAAADTIGSHVLAAMSHMERTAAGDSHGAQ